MNDNDGPGLARRLAHHTRRVAGGRLRGLLLFSAIGFALAAAAVFGFAALAEEVFEGDTKAFDTALLHWAGAHRSPALNDVALQVTGLGSAATLITIVLVAAALLWVSKHRGSVYMLAIALVSGAGLGVLLKNHFHRQRPTIIPWLSHALTTSFPSGHSMDSAVTYGTIAYLVGRLASKPLRIVVYWVAAVLVVSIGVSRVYIGVHYPSDVVAGWLAGIAWTALIAVSTRVYPAVFRDRKED